MTRLWLMQHGRAHPKEVDPERPLTDAGQEEVERMSAFVAAGRLDPVGRIVHSGKLRARQTAEVLASHFASVELEESDGLSPMDDPAIWAGRLTGVQEPLALVGHLPHLARLASLLLGGGEEAAEAGHSPVVAFRNAGIACLERGDAGDWSLAWALVPEVLPA